MTIYLAKLSPRYAAKQRGLSLIELMISMLLGLILLFAATTLFETVKKTTLVQEANARLQENGRAAIEILNRDIRLARYFGCAGVETTRVLNHWDSSTGAQSPTTLNGYDQQGIFGIDGATSADPDQIIVYHAVDSSAVILASDLDLTTGGYAIKLADPLGNGLPAAGDWISITDCTQADVFPVSAIDPNSVTSDYAYSNCPSCTHSYLTNAVVLGVNRSQYHLTTGDNGRAALFVKDPGEVGNGTQLIENVDDMQISYGLDTDADGVANQYVAPSTVTSDCTTNTNSLCWRKVTSVRLALLLSTNNGIASRPQTYTFNGTTTTASDTRLRREFLTVVALRNYRP